MTKRVLKGGPYSGETLDRGMHRDFARTFEFTAKGQTGYYDETGSWNITGNVRTLNPSVRGGTDRTSAGTIGQP